MMIRQRHAERRRGAAAVETALVILPVVIFMCGVFEYSRLLMDWNVLNNAAREGCRYALANNTASTITTDVTNLITTRMGGEKSNFTNFAVTLSGTHNGSAVTDVTTLIPGDLINVKITGKYKFMNIIPGLPMPSLTLTSTVTMVCEGAT